MGHQRSPKPARKAVKHAIILRWVRLEFEAIIWDWGLKPSTEAAAGAEYRKGPALVVGFSDGTETAIPMVPWAYMCSIRFYLMDNRLGYKV